MFQQKSQLALRARRLQRFTNQDHEYANKVTATDIAFAIEVSPDTRPRSATEEPYPPNWIQNQHVGPEE